MVNMYNTDCMEFMKSVPDKFYELAIVDPPYGIERFKRGSLIFDKENKYTNGLKWDCKPNDKYFHELFRVSRYCIIWGMNNFTLPETEYFIVWDKKGAVDNFAQCELAWTNIRQPAKIFTYAWQGLSDGIVGRNKKEKSIHPTQKPVALYKWLLKNYAKPGDKILDTHGGSGSICIACHDMGFNLDWMELDEDYYKAAVERYQRHAAQGELFDIAGGQIVE